MKFFRRLFSRPAQGSQAFLETLLNAADTPDMTDSGLFVASGLRAARGTSVAHRRTILTDLASVLDCEADELGFLFLDPVMAANDRNPVIMPDFRASMRGELQAVSY